MSRCRIGRSLQLMIRGRISKDLFGDSKPPGLHGGGQG